MTTTIQIEAGDLLASREDRIITGLLVPYGETGRTNLGRVRVRPGALAIPADPDVVHLNTDHDRHAVVGRAVDLHATDAGVLARFRVARTPEGDELLAEVATEGDPAARKRLSVEATSIVIRNGEIVSGRIYGAAAVPAGAFPSASLLAADAGEDPDHPRTAADLASPATTEVRVGCSCASCNAARDELARHYQDPPADPPAPDPTTVNDTLTPDPASDPAPEADPATPREDPDMTRPATAPVDLIARVTARAQDAITTTGDLFAAIAQAHQDRNGDLMAALADITHASHTPNVAPPQFVGELWEGVGYQRQYIPLFRHADLTSWTVAGWRWVIKPEVGKYLGNKTQVPSNTPTTAPVNIDAERIAGAHDIDRKFRDFKDTQFIESYYRAMTESYAEVSDVDVLDQVLGALTPTPVGTIPAGVAPGMAGIVRGYLKVLRATRRRPTFALVSDQLFEGMLYTPATAVTPYLEALLGTPGGFDDGFIRPSVDLAPDQVLVGVSDAVTVHELGGGSPIRVDALDIAKAGEDHGVFGYTAVNIHREDGLALIDTDPTAPAV